MMENKVPRKLKKELRKVDCLETSQPFIKMEPNPFSPSKMMFTQNSRVKLKEAFNRLRYESCEDWEEANQYTQNNLKVLSIW